jgi:hypothetical protein
MGSQVHVTSADLQGGQRSTYYESQRIPHDRARGTPVIPAPLIESAWLPLFLPYVALIDDPVLRHRCPARADPGGGFEARSNDSDVEANQREAQTDLRAAAAAECLHRIWEVRLDGELQSLEGFVVAERSDLGMRGLVGYLPLAGRAAGPHRLEVIWRPAPEQDTISEDYVPGRIRHLIPFVWSPEAAAVPAAPESMPDPAPRSPATDD